MSDPTPDAPLNATTVPIHDGLTVDQSNQIATVLFDPMVKRLTILLTSMVTQTSNGDMAYWCFVAALGATIRDLQWTNVTPAYARQFMDLGRVILRRYSEHLGAYRDEISAWESHLKDVPGSAVPFPQLRAWTNEDVQAIIDEVDALYAPKGDANGPVS